MDGAIHDLRYFVIQHMKSIGICGWTGLLLEMQLDGLDSDVTGSSTVNSLAARPCC